MGNNIKGMKKPSGKDSSKYVFGKTVSIKKKYTLGADLGLPGQFGKAQVCTEKKTGKKRAVKVIMKRNFGPEALASFRSEIQMLEALKHKNIVDFYDVFENLTTLWIVMELCSGGELFDRITEKHKKSGYSEKDAQVVLRQVAEGIKYMHDNKIAHCDLKPDNIMFMTKADDSVVKIIDFGMARTTHAREYSSKIAGTVLYMAPEVWNGKYTYHADVWSFGVIMFIVLFGFPPFHGGSDAEIKECVLRGFTPKTLPNYGAFFPEARPASDSAKDLISKMLISDQAKRCTIDEVLEHPWMTGEKASTSPLENVLKEMQTIAANTRLQKAILNTMSSSMSEDDLLSLKTSFEEIDKDGNGSITLKELQEALKDASGEAKKSMKDIETMMASADLDGDGELSYDEVVAASMHRRLMNKEERLWQQFAEIDKNGDGKLSKAELAEAFGTDSKEAQKMLDEVDKDGDGTIDYQEFLEIWMKEEETRVRSLTQSTRKGAAQSK